MSLEARLRQTLTSFNISRRSAIRTLLDLHGENPTAFALAAAKVLADPDAANSIGGYYLAGLIGRTDGIIDLLLHARMLSDPDALSLARTVARVDSLLDIRLMRKMMQDAGNDAALVPAAIARRALALVDATSDCSRLTTHLMRLTSHPSAYVRSKSALLLGRGNVNLNRVELFMHSEDSRTRANAIESLWGQKSQEARGIFQQATSDPDRRVAINALVGLCKAGGADAISRLLSLLQSEDPLSRRGAVWAMGQVADPEFAPVLEQLLNDSDQHVRSMAARSRAMLRKPAPAPPPPRSELVY
ncbi:MAG: HEAT repeat domain-containing protein [Bryobacterales bacterium]|nr:HEAT repeat domain-containing protein [Bryobacterales bacterium]MBV9399975.1 HEAT repeat domain-containing protein [Bryobacterales bacterium]